MWRACFLVILWLAAPACGDNPASPEPHEPVIQLQLGADSVILRIGRSIELTPVLSIDTVVHAADSVQYRSTDSTVITVLNGFVTALRTGDARVIGRQGDAVDTVWVIVPPRQPIALRFQPESLAVAIGDTVELAPSITLIDNDGTIIPPSEYTCAFGILGSGASVSSGGLTATGSGRLTLQLQCLGFEASVRVITYRPYIGTATVYRNNTGTGSPYPIDVAGHFAVIGRPAPGTIQRIDLTTGAAEAAIFVDSLPADIELTADGNRAYVATAAAATVAVVDLVAGAVIARWALPPAGGAANRLRLVGQRLVVATFDGALHVLDATTGTLDTSYASVVWFGPQDIWVEGNQVTVIEENRSARVIDIVARETVRSLTFPLASYTYGIAYRGDTVFAASIDGIQVDVPGSASTLIMRGLANSDAELSPDGAHLFVPGLYFGSNLALNVIDWKANYLVAAFHLGNSYWKGTLRLLGDGSAVLAGAEGILVLRAQ